jgi:hypothetical protein
MVTRTDSHNGESCDGTKKVVFLFCRSVSLKKKERLVNLLKQRIESRNVETHFEIYYNSLNTFLKENNATRKDNSNLFPEL